MSDLDKLHGDFCSMVHLSSSSDDSLESSIPHKSSLDCINTLNLSSLKYEGTKISKGLSPDRKKILKKRLFVYSYSSRFTDSKILIECADNLNVFNYN